MQRTLAIILLVLTTATALSESGAPVIEPKPPSPPQSYNSYGPYPYTLNYDPREPKLFDDKVFDLTSKPPPVKDAKGYYTADDPDYNTGQREAWIKECESLKEVDFKQFQQCYRDHKSRDLSAIREKMEYHTPPELRTPR